MIPLYKYWSDYRPVDSKMCDSHSHAALLRDVVDVQIGRCIEHRQHVRRARPREVHDRITETLRIYEIASTII